MTEQPSHKIISTYLAGQDIHGGEGSKLFALLKKAVDEDGKMVAADSNAGASVGVKCHLIEKDVARELRDFNATHAICIDAKKSSSVGLGHREREIHETLDPLCRFSWQDTLDALAEDYWETGECFLEVVFNDDNPKMVTGLYHIESAQINVELEEENKSKKFHYLVQGDAGGGELKIMAQWGDLQDLKRRFNVTSPGEGSDDLDGIPYVSANDAPVTDHGGAAASGDIVNSEVLHIRQATNRSPYYGYPDYMSAVPSIELVQCMTQHEFDFYFNRGVPQFMLFLLGKNIGGCWAQIEQMMSSNQGMGNSFKSNAVHIPGNPEETVVQVEKLAMEDAGNSGFSEKSGTLDMRIATAHGMPPQLANIALPGKIGGANEGPNAMLTFQMRKLGQAQKNFSGMLARSLGSKDISFLQPEGEPKSLSADLFLAKNAKSTDENDMPQFVQPGNGFNTILDGISLGAAETLNTMKEPIAGSGRDLNDGKLGGARDRKPGDPKQSRPAAGQGKPKPKAK